MLRSIRYKSGAIHISSRLLYSHLPDDINLSALQHRLSYDELRDCWKRMQTCIASNVKTQKWLLGLFGVLFLIMLIMLLLKVNMNVVGLFWAFSFIICVIGMIINTIQMNKKLNHLIEKENHTIWNTRGLFWKYSVKAKRRKGKHSYLKLKVLKSAMSYNAPGQPFQGTLSNPYMQQPVNYIQQVELSKYSSYKL